MGLFEGIKKFISYNSALEKAALEIYERLSVSLRNRIFLGSLFLRWVAFLKESEYWDREKLQTYQLEQLKDVLKHSKENVPYYRKLFSDYGFNPENIQTLEDIKVLPYLSKETIRDRIEEFIDVSMPRKALFKKSTSGSTGIPLTIYKTKESCMIFLAFRVNLFNRIGYTPKCREVMFWSMIDLGKKKNLPFLQYGNKLILSNRYLTDEWLFRYAEMIREFQPEFIAGFPSSLSILASFIKKNGSRFCKGLKAALSYAETLYDWQRHLIEEVFCTRVFSMYAVTEFAVIGGECEYSPYLHIYPQYGFTEFSALDSDHEEIIATGFTNYAMPFIRYRTGDIIRERKEFCTECRRHHQLIDYIEGRINDFLINKEGGIIPRLMPWIEIFPNTKRYQFFQEEPGKAFLKIVRAETYSQSDTIYIKSKLEEMLGPMKDSIHIEIVFVDHILETSGKCKLVDQRLNIKQYLQV